MKRLLITSPQGYAERLLKAFGSGNRDGEFEVTSIPMIQTVIHTSEEFVRFISKLTDYDYVAFSSRKAIEALAAYVEAQGIELTSQVKWCAIGKDNEALSTLLHVEPAFIAEEPSPMGIVHELAAIDGIAGRRIAVLAPKVVGMEEPHIVPDFIACLERIGMQVDRITAYHTLAASSHDLQHARCMMEQGQIDAIVFTSGTEIQMLLRTLPQGMDANTFLKDINIICYGPYTASCAQKLGLKVDFTSPRFGSFQQLVEEMIGYEVRG